MIRKPHTEKIETFEELEHLFKNLREQENQRELIYRGQADANWEITSSLEREIVNNIPYKNITVELYDKIAEKHFKNLEENIKPILRNHILLSNKNFETNLELWAIGQHLGLKTPLIDWTKSFYIALYFAFYKEEPQCKYRAVFQLSKNLVVFQGKLIKNNFLVFEPKFDDYKRLTAQRGLFTYWGFSGYIYEAIEKAIELIKLQKTEEELSTLKMNIFKKYEISNSLRDEILQYLEHIGFNHTTLFPDIGGAVDKTNIQLSNLLNQHS